MTRPRRASLWGYALILTAACLWATLGLFYRSLVEDYGLSRQVVVAFRAGVAALALAAGLALRQPAALRIRRSDLPFFLVFGIFGVAAFYLSYIAAITAGSVALAAVLLYTAPIWIAIWAVVHDDEALEGARLAALGLAVIGCALVAQAYDPAQLKLNGPALLYGLLSGVGYAAYSLWSAAGTRRGYNAWTVVFYSLGIGAVVLFAIAPVHETLKALRTPAAWPLLLGVGLLPSLLAPICFTLGLQHVRTSNASILATVEPVAAAGLAWAFLGEALSLPQIAGGGCVLLAVLILVRSKVRRTATETRRPALQHEP
jgi:DME family drug/metabolite transporter